MPTLSEAVLIAAYAIFQAKESVTGVGKETQTLVLLEHGGLGRIPADIQGELDMAVRRYSNTIEPLVFRSMTADSALDNTLTEIRNLRITIADILQKTSFSEPHE